MALFAPWIGNFNPTDQQKDEYIRQLKSALTEIQTPTVSGVGYGTYTGTGAASQIITLDNADLEPSFIIVGSLDKAAANMHINFSFPGYAGKSFKITTGAIAPTMASNSITDISTGTFTVRGTGATDLNTNGLEFAYIVIGNS